VALAILVVLNTRLTLYFLVRQWVRKERLR
jgi:hypothetical protein